jgi:hypothetical protein
VFCALLVTFSLCIGILQFISVELFTFSFCVGIIHIISVEHFHGAKMLGEGGSCCSNKENDRQWLWGQGMRPLLCAQMRLAPALALKTHFAIGCFAPLEGQIPPSKGQAHAAPALCKNTLIKSISYFVSTAVEKAKLCRKSEMRNHQHCTTNHKKCDCGAMTAVSRALSLPPQRGCPPNSRVTSLDPPSALPSKQFLICRLVLLLSLSPPTHITSALALLSCRRLVCQRLRLSFAPPAGCCITSCPTASISCHAAISRPLDVWPLSLPLIGAAASCHLQSQHFKRAPSFHPKGLP